MRRALLAAICLLAAPAFAQQPADRPPDDLDVTMQIIVDPDAKLPEEVIRRIPLPARAPSREQSASAREPARLETAQEGQRRASEARELGREMAERARERAERAAEQREEARRSAAEDRRRNPPQPPGRPERLPPR